MVKQALPGMLEDVIEQFAAAIAARTEALFARSARGAAGKARGGPRICPYPGCRKAGKGPRNRWFCKDHSRSVPVREQKRILAERAKAGGAALVVKAKRRTAANKGRKLNMSCRVEGCKNASRGPRFGFICDDHRKKLSASEQAAAREKWKAAHPRK